MGGWCHLRLVEGVRTITHVAKISLSSLKCILKARACHLREMAAVSLGYPDLTQGLVLSYPGLPTTRYPSTWARESYIWQSRPVPSKRVPWNTTRFRIGMHLRLENCFASYLRTTMGAYDEASVLGMSRLKVRYRSRPMY